MNKNFPNGFEDWHETHFEIVSAISEATLLNISGNEATRTENELGKGGLYELAERLTDKFESENKGVEWGSNDSNYCDTMETFIEKEIYK